MSSISSKYRAISVFSHLLLLISLVLSIILLSVIPLHLDFFRQESKFYKDTFSLAVIYYNSIIFNITIFLFTSCAIYSRTKFYMRIYLLSSFCYLCMLIFFLLMTYSTYKNTFSYNIAKLSTTGSSDIRALQDIFKCSEFQPDNTCTIIIGRIIDKLINLYTILSGAIIICNFILFVLIKIATTIDIYLPEKPPVHTSNKFVGYGSESLRTRRVIPIKQSPDTITLSTISEVLSENASVRGNTEQQ
ncbi:hypothetical protein SLOPH_1782 [Spraguea lophii 42_110]|uniref:Uncharacterized protein n=1 Tax=Spraguea lophii (strain 42_110) TaxID=1358809 RepID=S7W675_SPRLO|nr:hypothetical protein SLOPH_1782 [Spraguea lophii 42_110]